MGRPKRQNILVYLSNCAVRMRTKSGQALEIQENGIYYAPQGAEYILDVQHQEDGSTIGVNFHLFDENGEPMVFSEDVLCFRASATAARAFEEMARVGTGTVLQSRILLETVISEIGREEPSPAVPAAIRDGVAYLQEHYTESPSVSQLAAMSHVSEVYFRRLFKRTFQISPAAYVTRLKLNMAAEHLEYGEMSVQEIAELVGYSSVSYFAQEFKATYGVTPLRYRREKTE